MVVLLRLDRLQLHMVAGVAGKVAMFPERVRLVVEGGQAHQRFKLEGQGILLHLHLCKDILEAVVTTRPHIHRVAEAVQEGLAQMDQALRQALEE